MKLRRREYQRQGLGRRLVGHVARRFLGQGIGSMVLFGEARNPSCAFWDAPEFGAPVNADSSDESNRGVNSLKPRRLTATSAAALIAQ